MCQEVWRSYATIKKLFFSAALFPCLTTVPLKSMADDPSMADYTLCGVYQFMTIGAMRRRGGIETLQDGELEKMNRHVALARQAASEEYGKELGAEIFQDEWQAILRELTDKINRNYDNISKIRYLYKSRCDDYLDQSANP